MSRGSTSTALRAVGSPIWVIDDSPSFLTATSSMLQESGFRVRGFSSPGETLVALKKELPHVIVSDILMPGINGVELLARIREIDPELPVILVSSSPNLEFATRAIQNGAFELLTKPVSQEQLLLSVGRAVKYMDMAIEKERSMLMLDVLVKMRTSQLTDTMAELKRSRFEIIHALTMATEYRDNETAEHIRRIGLYSRKLARSIGKADSFCEEIFFSSPMHDIGKIGIPDSLLFKKDTLSSREFTIMKKHTKIGAKMLSGSESSIMHMARDIALSHHERWDGTGYPDGLKGSSIPVTARIVNIVDQYDALRCRRPYKPSYSHEEACKILWRGDDRTSPEHFDPEMAEVFMDTCTDFDAIYEDNSITLN